MDSRPDLDSEARANRRHLKAAAQIVIGATALACLLGLAVDVVTANVAVEYFTLHHAKVVESQSPWMMALVWGVGASWWAGMILGAILAWLNGRLRPPLEPRRVLRMVAMACAVVWVLMMLVLVGIYGIGGLVPLEHRRPSFEHDRRLMAVAISHLTEYFLAVGATVILALRMAVLSRRARAES